MKTKDPKQIRGWIKKLTAKQKCELIETMLWELIDSCSVRFPEDANNPYWQSCGEGLVDGLEPFDSEEEDD